MNTATILGTIVSLLLATAALSSTRTNSATEKPAPPGHNLNHNETLLREISEKSPPDVQALDYIRTGLVRLVYSGFGCSPTVCGTNHNETLLRNER